MSWSIRLAADEGCEAEVPFLSPDLVITQAIGPAIHFDHLLAEPVEVGNRGGFSARRGLHTAVVIQLFSDRRLPDGVSPLDELDPDPRGWWGDTIDRQDGEDDIGSLLWTLRRAPLNKDTTDRAEDYCREALQCLVDQGAVARFDVACEGQRGPNIDQTAGLLAIAIDGFAQDGSRVYSQKFQVLWDQIDALRRER